MSGINNKAKSGSKSKSSEIISSITDFTSSRSPSPVNINNASAKTTQELFGNTPSTARLMQLPPSVKAAAMAASLNAMSSASEGESAGGLSFFKYFIILLVLGVLGLTLFLYLEKPADKDITQIYDPILNYLGLGTGTGISQKLVETPKQNTESVQKLEKILNEKKVVNNIDKDNNDASKAVKKPTKKSVVVPEPIETQLTKPKSKAGFCYIGEDRGVRSCVNVGEGDICMSGDIFPSQEICINPSLRE